MTTIGNLVLCFASLCYVGLLFTMSRNPGTEDAAQGYAWLSVLCSLAMLVCLAFVSIVISRNHGFIWISPSRGARLFLVTLGLLSAICTTGLCAVFLHEKARMSVPVRMLVTVIPVVLPLIPLFSATVLLNGGLRAAIPVAVYRLPLAATLVMGLGGIATVVCAYRVEQRQEEKGRQEKLRAKTLKRLEQADPQANGSQ